MMNIQVRRGICGHRIGSRIIEENEFKVIWRGQLDTPLIYAASSGQTQVYSASNGNLFKLQAAETETTPTALIKVGDFESENIFEVETEYETFLGEPTNSDFPFISFEQEFFLSFFFRFFSSSSATSDTIF